MLRSREASSIRAVLVVSVVAGVLLIPASAQADPVFADGCRAQVTGRSNSSDVTFTIRCGSKRINGARFVTSQGAILPGGFQGEEPGHGLTCLPSGGTPNRPQFTCGGRLDPGETGTAHLQTMEPCQNGFTVRNLGLDTGGDPPPPLDPFEADVQFPDVRIQCGAGGGGGNNTCASGNSQRGRIDQDARAERGGNAANQAAIIQQNACRDARALVRQIQTTLGERLAQVRRIRR